ncbi:MAG TPA: glycosyltransferase family 4 protein, partial [Rhodocyclaceae bacterium]|nr:glycosyltransferase family 4 protein [Rhodocyclaceae bacterium]
MTLPLVAHLLPNYNAFPPVIPAGTELRVEQVGLRHSRYQPLVVCGAFPGQPLAERIGVMEIRRIAFGRLYRRLFQKLTRLDPLPYGRRMWSIIRASRAALLHIHNEPKLLAGLAPYLRQHPLPTVVHIANHKPFRRDDLPLVTRFVACSRFMARWLTEEYGLAPQRVEVIHTGVDIANRPPRWALEPGRRLELR